MIMFSLRVLCILRLAAAARYQMDLSENVSYSEKAGSKCCCKAESFQLGCQILQESEQESSFWSGSQCPASERKYDAGYYFDTTELRSCPMKSMTLGPAASKCTGSTASCACHKTIDAQVPSIGLLKGRVLRGHGVAKAGAGPRVAGFFEIPYAEYKGRWALSGVLTSPFSVLPKKQCGKSPLHQLRAETRGSNSVCYQWVPGLGYIGSDSCLTLDVYTPAVVTVPADKGGRGASDFRLREDERLPVMVFIFGGGFVMGDKYQNGIYDGRHLAQHERVIVVSVNYRLGPFGFLHHPDLGGQTNFGLHDQFQALRWIQENIHAFGGDPDKVTLFGESAGAMSACAHLASPTSRRLFSNVILESGNCDGLFVWQPHQYALAHGTRYLRSVFGRIRGCARKGVQRAAMKAYKERENDCSSHDTASLEEVLAKCGDLFLGTSSASVEGLASVLPFENARGCDAEYAGCDQSLPSGRTLDAALLECGRRLDIQYLWTNQYALNTRIRREDSTYMRKWLGFEFTGLPMPPHLWWGPVVDPSAPGSLDFAAGGLMPLPGRVFRDPVYRPSGPRMITAGWNRDEGSLFTFILPSFWPDVDFSGALSDEGFAEITRSVVCADWSPSGQGPQTSDCESRVQQALHAYETEGSKVGSPRGKCCTEDPNNLRLQRMLTDYLFACPQLRTLTAFAADESVQARAYNFGVDDELPSWTPDLKHQLGAFHFSELFFAFGDENEPGGNLPFGGGALGLGLGWTKKDGKVSKEVSDSWGEIGRNEPPHGWPRLTPEDGTLTGIAKTILKNDPKATTSIADLYTRHHCDVMDALQSQLLSDVLPASA